MDGIAALDVRPILAGGADPLDEILAALATLVPGAALMITAPFAPRPLVRLMRHRGHGVQVRAAGGGDFCAVIRVADTRPPADLRELEAPEPMERILVVAEELEPGAAWLGWVPRYPRLLLPLLADRDVASQVELAADGAALVHLRKPSSGGPT